MAATARLGTTGDVGGARSALTSARAQLAIAAIESIATDYEAQFARWRTRGVSAADIVRRLARLQAQWLMQTEFRQAGLLSTLVQGFVPDAPDLHETLARTHMRRQWLFERALSEDGWDDVTGLAALALAALDGGMIQAAAARDGRGLRLAAEHAARCLDIGAARG